jgi:hypothetical protein
MLFFKKNKINYYLKNNSYDERFSINNINQSKIEYVNKSIIKKNYGYDERFPINNINNQAEIEHINELFIKKNILNYLESQNVSLIDKLAVAENYLDLNKITSYNLTKYIKIE